MVEIIGLKESEITFERGNRVNYTKKIGYDTVILALYLVIKFYGSDFSLSPPFYYSSFSFYLIFASYCLSFMFFLSFLSLFIYLSSLFHSLFAGQISLLLEFD